MTLPAWLYKHGWLPDRRSIRRLELEEAWTAGYRAAILEQQRGMDKPVEGLSK